MTVYNGDEVLEIAQQIERNGERFYRHAADIVTDETARKILTQLAEWEVRHKAIFAELQKGMSSEQLTDPGWYDPNHEGAQYLQMIAGSEVFRSDLDPETVLPAGSDACRAFEVAIGLEKESVVFYTAMRNVVPETLGREQLEAIIDEELKHVRILTREREKAKGID